ncbi:unnamed protein product [Acanthoscelides obtectus]|nr:unnamed protein product [Acanthoscelides obtectus]CAK1675567.1 Zinc finger protein 142 [Acanthoscelides obtectus]
MEEFCEFKFKCLITEEKIKKFKVLERRHSGDKADRYICRFCKEDITEMSIKPLMEWLKDGLQEIVEAHFPEIDIYAVKDSFICKPCSQNIYNFGQFTAAWSNNNFNGDWVNGLVKKEHNPVEKCNTEKDEESSNTKLNTGAMIDTEGNARRKPIETPNKICKSQMPQPFQEDCLKKEPVDRNSTEGLEVVMLDGEHCKKRAKRNSVLNKHKCSKCDFSHKFKSSVKDHQKVHKDIFKVLLYKCGFCPFESRHKAAVYTHNKLHKDPSELKMYKCGECDYQAKIKSQVISHQRMHKLAMLKCTECNFETKYRESLSRHKMVHKNGADVKTFKCYQCSYTTKRKHNLKGHMLKHKDEGVVMHKCDSCRFQTKYVEALSRHKTLLHLDGKIYQCPHCNYKAKIKSYLGKHLMNHKDSSELKRYNCNFCSYSAKGLAQRNSHMKVMHNPPKFQCAICGNKVRTKRNLNVHIISKHPRKLWSKCSF